MIFNASILILFICWVIGNMRSYDCRTSHILFILSRLGSEQINFNKNVCNASHDFHQSLLSSTATLRSRRDLTFLPLRKKKQGCCYSLCCVLKPKLWYLISFANAFFLQQMTYCYHRFGVKCMAFVHLFAYTMYELWVWTVCYLNLNW